MTGIIAMCRTVEYDYMKAKKTTDCVYIYTALER